MNEKKLPIGGQALIEGIMMRSKNYYSMVVKKKDGSLKNKLVKFISFTSKFKFLDIIFIRGMINFLEMLYIGIKSLNFSSNEYEEDNEKEKEKQKKEKSNFINNLVLAGSLIFSFGLAILLFLILPSFLLEFIIKEKQNPLIFNLLLGTIKIIMFFLYIIIISFNKDVKRVFQFHGAEHKVVNSYEQDIPLNMESVQNVSTFHPRCGTSFLFFVILVSIFIYSFIPLGVEHYNIMDFFNKYQFDEKSLRWITKGVYWLFHILFLPIVASIAYELIRFSYKYKSNKILSLFLLPGKILQKITALEPNKEMIEVSLEAFNLVLDAENKLKK